MEVQEPLLHACGQLNGLPHRSPRQPPGPPGPQRDGGFVAADPAEEKRHPDDTLVPHQRRLRRLTRLCTLKQGDDGTQGEVKVIKPTTRFAEYGAGIQPDRLQSGTELREFVGW